jgi:hypothetical protein
MTDAERFWKFVKKHCLYYKDYPDSAAFQQASTEQAALDSVLTLKFQTFAQMPLLNELQPASSTNERLPGKSLPMAAYSIEP